MDSSGGFQEEESQVLKAGWERRNLLAPRTLNHTQERYLARPPVLCACLVPCGGEAPKSTPGPETAVGGQGFTRASSTSAEGLRETGEE